jgi:heterotetrameric sarcosine oxidase delta subunit
MSRLICPFCGPRELREFEFHKTLPNAGHTPFEQVYLRVDSLTLSVEHWQHIAGCRAWLHIERNPSTGEVLVCRLARAEGVS